MNQIIRILRSVNEREEGHAPVGIAAFIAGIGGVVLGVGAAADSDVAAVIGGIALGTGVFAAALAQHLAVDYDLYRRMDELENR